MTASSMLGRPATAASRAIPSVLATVALAGAALFAGFVLTDPRGLRVLIAAALVLVFIGLGFLAPRRLLYALVVWLTALGFLRRFVSEYGGASSSADVLLLVGPAAIVVLFLIAARHDAFRNRTNLANAVLALSLLALLGAVNPLQGSLVAGLAGLLFILVPTLGFWIGRVLCDDRTLKRVLITVAFFSLIEAAYGLAQTFSGFPSWDSAWIATHEEQYAALYVGDFIRPFGSFSSFAEYSYFLGIGLIVWVAVATTRKLLLLAAPAALLLIVAIFYASTRTTVVALIAALGLTMGARRRLPFGVAVVFSAALLLLVPLVGGYFDHAGSNAGASESLASHQIGGLANPLDPRQSSLRGHLTLMKVGLVDAANNPLGNGIGGVTIAGARFGGVEQSTESDPSNVAVALGFPGLGAYLVLLASGFLYAYRVAVDRRDPLALIALAIATLLVLQWINGGQYSVALIFWLALGWVDKTIVAQRSGRITAASARAQ
jgi:hypothetical protein